MFHKILMVHILSSSKVKTDVCILHASWWRTYLNCISLKSSQYGGSNVVLYHSNNIYSRNQMETWIQLVRIRISKSDTYLVTWLRLWSISFSLETLWPNWHYYIGGLHLDLRFLSFDFSQAEKKMTVAWPFVKFTKGQLFSLKMFLGENSCHFVWK